MRYPILAVLTLLSAVGVAFGARGLGLMPASGPDAAVDLHVRLFRALEEENVEMIHQLVRNDGPQEPLLYVVDANNRPRTLRGADAPEQWIKAWRGEGEESVTGSTLIRTSEVLGDSTAPAPVVVVLELSRAVLRKNEDEKKPVIHRYRCTSVVTRPSSDPETYRVSHLHLSPVESYSAAATESKDDEQP